MKLQGTSEQALLTTYDCKSADKFRRVRALGGICNAYALASDIAVKGPPFASHTVDTAASSRSEGATVAPNR